MSERFSKDLIVIAADKDAEHGMRGILSRHQSLGIRPVNPEFYIDRLHDSHVIHRAAEILRLYLATHAHAIVLMDRDGCGREDLSRTELETVVESRLRASGWGERAAAVVIDPELEVWVWSNSPHIDEILGWRGRDPKLRAWLQTQGYVKSADEKPGRPKEAMRHALRESQRHPSSSLFRQIAEHVTLRDCRDAAFGKLLHTLQNWFMEG